MQPPSALLNPEYIVSSQYENIMLTDAEDFVTERSVEDIMFYSQSLLD